MFCSLTNLPRVSADFFGNGRDGNECSCMAISRCIDSRPAYAGYLTLRFPTSVVPEIYILRSSAIGGTFLFDVRQNLTSMSIFGFAFRPYFLRIAERPSDEALMCLNPDGAISEIVP